MNYNPLINKGGGAGGGRVKGWEEREKKRKKRGKKEKKGRNFMKISLHFHLSFFFISINRGLTFLVSLFIFDREF